MLHLIMQVNPSVSEFIEPRIWSQPVLVVQRDPVY
jgi:hypothetical protein